VLLFVTQFILFVQTLIAIEMNKKWLNGEKEKKRVEKIHVYHLIFFHESEEKRKLFFPITAALMPPRWVEERRRKIGTFIVSFVYFVEMR
jgi:hypothetical protein